MKVLLLCYDTKIRLFLGLFLLTISLFSQDYSVFNIPNNIKENANAVIRHHTTIVTVDDHKSMTIKRNVAITVFNESASSLGDFVASFNNN